MSVALSIPTTGEQDSLSFTLENGDVVFIVGPNGSGKSSLMHRIYAANALNARRLSAHRQTWLASGALSLTAHQKKQNESNIDSADKRPESRWKDDYSSARTSITIFDLVDAENSRARGIAAAVDRDDFNLARELSTTDSPLASINQLLEMSNLPIEISVRESEEVVASKDGGAPYSIAELSDGERNALIVAADVLTTKPGTLILIDEPERHLHRSIISPLLTLLFQKRKDCVFVVSTHDVSLVSDNPDSRALLVRGCSYTGKTVSKWDLDLLPPGSRVGDSFRREILGSRRRMVFVEGTETSLDKALYSLIFPGVSIIPRASCRDVEHAVVSLRSSSDLHWIRPFGIVDNDQRSSDEIQDLMGKGVFPLPLYSVESIYYHPIIQQSLAERQGELVGSNPESAIAQARTAALDALEPHAERLSRRVAIQAVREEFFSHIPNSNIIAPDMTVQININIGDIYSSELDKFRGYMQSQNIQALISRYPVRETPALNQIAKNLGFQDRLQYESAVRKLLMDDNAVLTSVRRLFANLPAELGILEEPPPSASYQAA